MQAKGIDNWYCPIFDNGIKLHYDIFSSKSKTLVFAIER